MGVVYKAHDPQIDRSVALKVLREDRVSSDDFVRRFLKEAMAVGRLSHPGIVTVYDVGQDHGSIYIAMEFLQGTPLDELMNSRRFSAEESVSIGMQAAQALHYAHQHGIVHRDIKPPNIIYSPEGTIRITDFGIARIEDPAGQHMTQAGEILGTPLYMSPEQVTGMPLDGRSDLYSLGVLLYQLTTGQRPFSGANLAAVFRAIVQDTPAAPHAVDPAIPQALSRIIMRLLAKEPEQRFASGEELLHALQSCLAPAAYGRARQMPASAPRPFLATGLGKAVVLGLVVLVFAGVGVGLYLWYMQPAPPGPAESPLLPSAARQGEPPVSPPADVAAKSQPEAPAATKETGVGQQTPKPSTKGKKNVPFVPETASKAKEPRLDAGRPVQEPEPGRSAGPQTRLSMNSQPVGAELYVDGKLMGKTPLQVMVPSGKHEVQLKLARHLGWQAQVDLSQGGEVPLMIRLLPEQAQ